MTTLARTTQVLDAAREARVFSAVAAEVGREAGVAWRHASGRLAFDEAAPQVTDQSLFDLASLTKVLSTTTLALGLVERQALDLSTRIAELLPTWSQTDRAAVTVRDLFEHSAGLPAHRPYYLTLTGRAQYESAIAHEVLEYAPRSRSVYSDLGFMLLGFILEDVGGDRLDGLFRRWRSSAGIDARLDYGVPPARRADVVITETDPWRGRPLQGEVHDENAAALGGVAGHAGLFGTAEAVGQAARWWLRQLTGGPMGRASSAFARLFVHRSAVPGSSRAIGWDTMLPTSSCGSRLSTHAIGHTGFTGTSLWIDPAQDLYAVLLTNRVHPTRASDAVQQVRRDFHDAIIADLEER